MILLVTGVMLYAMATASIQWLGDLESKPAPGALRLVQALINTVDRESGQDRLAEAADAEPWLVTNHLLEPGSTLIPDDLLTLAGVREALRAMVIHNTGGPAPSRAALAPLRQVAASGPARVQLHDDGTVRLGPDGSTLTQRLIEILLVVKDAQLDGTWGQLKACANDECQWAFYDRSRNHGGTWCDMSTCGNKLKNRDFRARKREQ
jgi:predicted RNA-binding Zn ribbon-like protein